jgi:hypothetical protein
LPGIVPASFVLDLEGAARPTGTTGHSREVRDLIREMCRENPSFGAPRIHGELLELGIDIGESSVRKYMVHGRKPPSQTWRTFLENHAQQLVSIDFFTVPTLRFQVLYVFLVLAHDRRRILHFNVTAHPTAEWTQDSNCGRHFPSTNSRATFTDREPIFRWGRTHPSHERFSRRKWDPSWRCRKSVDCITATNDGLPESARIHHATRCLRLAL